MCLWPENIFYIISLHRSEKKKEKLFTYICICYVLREKKIDFLLYIFFLKKNKTRKKKLGMILKYLLLLAVLLAAVNAQLTIKRFGKTEDETVGQVHDLTETTFVGILPRAQANTGQFFMSDENKISVPFDNQVETREVLMYPTDIGSDLSITYLSTLLSDISVTFEPLTGSEYRFVVSGNIFDPVGCVKYPGDQFCVRYLESLGDIHFYGLEREEAGGLSYKFGLVVAAFGKEETHYYPNFNLQNMTTINADVENPVFIPFNQEVVASVPENIQNLKLYLYFGQDILTTSTLNRVVVDIVTSEGIPVKNNYSVSTSKWLYNFRLNLINDVLPVNRIYGGRLTLDWVTAQYGIPPEREVKKRRDEAVSWGLATSEMVMGSNIMLDLYTQLGVNETSEAEIDPVCSTLLSDLTKNDNTYDIPGKGIEEHASVSCPMFVESGDTMTQFSLTLEIESECPGNDNTTMYLPAVNDILFVTLSESVSWVFPMGDFVPSAGVAEQNLDSNKESVECLLELLDVQLTEDKIIETDCITSTKHIPDFTLGKDIEYTCDLCDANYTYIDYKIINMESSCDENECTELIRTNLYVYALDRDAVCLKAIESNIFDEIVIEIHVSVGETYNVFLVRPMLNANIDCGEGKVIRLRNLLEGGDITPKRNIENNEVQLLSEYMVSLNQSIFIGFDWEQLEVLLNTTSDDWEDILLDLFPSLPQDILDDLLSQLAILDEEPTTPPPTTPPPTTTPPTTPPIDGSTTHIDYDIPESTNYMKGVSVVMGISITASLAVVLFSSFSSTHGNVEDIPLLGLGLG